MTSSPLIYRKPYLHAQILLDGRLLEIPYIPVPTFGYELRRGLPGLQEIAQRDGSRFLQQHG